jgi:hypothetical protein
LKKGPFKTLGIWFSKNKEEMLELNFADRKKKLKNLIQTWVTQDLTPKGKITVITTLDLPQILYVASVLCVPDRVCSDIQVILNNFLWSYKPPKIKLETIIGSIEDGGLKMPHVRSLIKALNFFWIS